MNPTQKKSLRESIAKKSIALLLKGSLDLSSKTMLTISLGVKPDFESDFKAPTDPSGFRRCHDLVEKIPEIAHFFPEIAKKVPEFKGLIENWAELSEVYKKDKALNASAELSYLIRQHGKSQPPSMYQYVAMALIGRQEAIDYVKDPTNASFIKQFLINKSFSTVSYNHFSRGIFSRGISDVPENSGGEVVLKMDETLNLVLDVDSMNKKKSTITDVVAKEVSLFVKNGRVSKKDEEKVGKIMDFLGEKYPEIKPVDEKPKRQRKAA